MIVLLQGNGCNVVTVNVDKFGLRIIGEQIRYPIQVDLTHLPIARVAIQVYDTEESAGCLGRTSIPQVFIPFVFNGDGSVATVGADGHCIRLSSQINLAHNALCRNVNHQQLAARRHKTGGGIDRHQGKIPGHRNGGRLTS